MHYRPYSFNVDPNIPTITTNIPEFNNIIGQYLDFSKLDMLRLNRMYNCCKCCETYDRECYLFVLTQLCGSSVGKCKRLVLRTSLSPLRFCQVKMF